MPLHQTDVMSLLKEMRDFVSNLELLKKLIKIESISPNDNGCFDVIKQQFDGLDFSFEEINYKNISNLIITNGDSKIKLLFFRSYGCCPSWS